MKKYIAVLAIAAFSVAGIASKSAAQTDNNPVAVYLDVNGAFDLVVGLPGEVNFTGVNAANVGDEKFQGLGLTVNNNHGAEWTIALSAPALTHTDAVTTIPAGSFRYQIGGTPAAGTYVPGIDTLASVPTVPTTIFTAAPAFYTVSGLGFGFGIVVNVPVTQKAGSYNTTMNLALIDAI